MRAVLRTRMRPPLAGPAPRRRLGRANLVRPPRLPKSRPSAEQGAADAAWTGEEAETGARSAHERAEGGGPRCRARHGGDVEGSVDVRPVVRGDEACRICVVDGVVEDVAVAIQALAPVGSLHDGIGAHEAGG